MAPMISEKGAYQIVGSSEANATENDRKSYTGGAPTAQRPSRRLAASFLTIRIALLVASTLVLCIHMVSSRHAFPCRSRPVRELSVEERVDKILTSTPLIDGHNDFAITIRGLFNNHIYSDKFRKGFEKEGLPRHVDLPRLRAGKNGGAFWSVYTPCPENGTDLSDENYAQSIRDTLQQIDLVARLKEAYPDVFSPDGNSSTALAAFKRGQLISPLGIEGLHQIGNSVANLRRYHAMGVRYATLTHNCPNNYADAALWEGPVRKAPRYWGGLSPLGRQVILEMNRLGLIVDLSHTSVDTMVDVLVGRKHDDASEVGADAAAAAAWTGSKAPVIFSHSSAYSVCPHPRNVPDHVLQLVKQRGGLVMVNFAPDFVSCTWEGASAEARKSGIPPFYPANSTLEHVATHVLHIGRLIGFEHVGFGSDFDGIGSTPRGLDDVSAYPALVAELLRRGVTDDEARLVVGGNLLRVWREVDAVAEKLQQEGLAPLEDDLPSRWG